MGGQLTLVLGGARSGKSAVAERLVAKLPVPISYLATAVVDPTDADLVARVEAHRARRPGAWRSVEVGTDLAATLDITAGSVLIDALGTWVAAHADLDPDVDGLLAALARRSGTTVVVSEEVGLGVHPSTEAGRRFRDVLGTVNAAVAEQADQVLLVVAGRVLPLERGPG